MDNIKKIQEILKKQNIKAYIIFTADYHNSEYICNYFKIREFLTGFTGSNGTLIITQDESRLWTDGRYFLQAENELKDTNIILMKDGLKDVLSILDYLNSILDENDNLAFDGKLVSVGFIESLNKKITKKINLIDNFDIIDTIWKNREGLSESKIYLLDTFLIGKSYQEKRLMLLDLIHKENASSLLLTSLEDICWLTNLRGSDIKYSPLFLSYLYINDLETYLFINKNKLDDFIIKYLKENNIIIKDYSDVYSFVLELKNNDIIIDKEKVNYLLYSSLKNNNNIILKDNPTRILKAIKNETEIKNTKLAHIKDGVVILKLMYMLKKSNTLNNLTEYDISIFLEQERKKQKGFIEPSFTTISAYNENAAMLHYSPNKTNSKKLNNNGILLVDSGGHYIEGTTDITRTYSLGIVSEEIKKHYTYTLKAMINLSDTTFIKGTKLLHLDIIARKEIWKYLLDYRCGTGHGVGHVLNVHDEPRRLFWKQDSNNSQVVDLNMIITNEPGIYIENSHGIRLENELLVIKAGESEYGEFLKFEPITYAPLDKDLIIKDLLNKEEINYLNNYHKLVYENLKDHLKDDELKFLETVCKEL